MKRETKGHFRPLLPMTDPRKRMKRGSAKIQALVSRETGLVSRRFTFRFTIPLASANKQRASVVRPSALLFRRFRGREFLEARIIPQRIPEWIDLEVRSSDSGRNFEKMR